MDNSYLASQNQNKPAIKFWPLDERPREKLIKVGEQNLSNTELLAILIRNGTQGVSAVDIARDIMRNFKNFRKLSCLTQKQWKTIKGLGTAKIAIIKAAIEIGRRFLDENLDSKQKINSIEDIIRIFMPMMRDCPKEVFKIALLDSQNQLLEVKEIAEGTLTSVNPLIKDIMDIALQYSARSIICAHNHPSGDPSPSKNDRNFTHKLLRISRIMEIRLFDHIVIGNNTYYSFAEKNKFIFASKI